jgi:hypothetical protein
MATKKSSIEPVSGAPQGSGRKQETAPTGLHETEWAFHTLKRKDELPYCALWELARLRGSKQKPWLKLAKKAKAQFIASEQQVLQEIPPTVGPVLTHSLLGHWFGKEHAEKKAITFLVDVSAGKGKLIEAFTHWLDSTPYRRKWRKKPKPTKARWRSLLSKIVVLRTHEAGLTWSDAINATAELWKAWKLADATQGLLSQPHWNRALCEAKALREPILEMIIVDLLFAEGATTFGPPFFRVKVGQGLAWVGQVKPGAMPVAE